MNDLAAIAHGGSPVSWSFKYDTINYTEELPESYRIIKPFSADGTRGSRHLPDGHERQVTCYGFYTNASLYRRQMGRSVIRLHNALSQLSLKAQVVHFAFKTLAATIQAGIKLLIPGYSTIVTIGFHFMCGYCPTTIR